MPRRSPETSKESKLVCRKNISLAALTQRSMRRCKPRSNKLKNLALSWWRFPCRTPITRWRRIISSRRLKPAQTWPGSTGFLKAFEKVDVIATPTTPTAAFKVGEKSDDPMQMYLSDIFTISCNLAGICGVSLPCGFTDAPKLPIGLQLLGKPFGEETMLKVAHAYEQATSWHKERLTVPL